jgi:energy-coupling factor transporter ATP-binding protein EcfA2
VNLLQLCAVTKRYPGVTALDSIDLDVEAGSVHALIGENGAGKSTLLKTIAAATQPDKGEIRADGKPAVFKTPRDALRRASRRTVSVLNDSKYGWDYKGNVLRLTLLRSPIWPDSLADRGGQRFSYAVYPHAGDWRAAQTVRRAAEYSVPLLAAFEPEHKGTLGKEVSFASAEPGNVELTWLKRAEDTDDWVLRLVEWHGVPAEAEVTLGLSCGRGTTRQPAGGSG